MLMACIQRITYQRAYFLHCRVGGKKEGEGVLQSEILKTLGKGILYGRNGQHSRSRRREMCLKLDVSIIWGEGHLVRKSRPFSSGGRK